MAGISRILAVIALTVCLLAACQTDSPQEPGDKPQMPADMPDDFHVRYDYFGQAVSPKYHYDYFILLDRVSQDTISFHPDYMESNPPIWIETFDAADEALEDLWDLMVDEDLFRDSWARTPDTLFGAWTRILQVTAADEHYTVPKWVQDTTSANAVYRRIDSLVPAAVWDSLWVWRERYIADTTQVGGGVGGELKDQ